MSDTWATVAELGTAAGTLVLAFATFASVRSANRSARTADRALLAGLRPLLVNSRPEDPVLKVGFQDQHWLHLAGGTGAAEVGDGAIYLSMNLRNVGAGIAVLHGWLALPDVPAGAGGAPDPATFRSLTRDLYVAPGDTGFWQGAFRDPAADDFAAMRIRIQQRDVITIFVLYGDFEGGQRTISRFSLTPTEHDTWLISISRHWNLDRPDPR